VNTAFLSQETFGVLLPITIHFHWINLLMTLLRGDATATRCVAVRS
jgi:hypothetical protein